jgi:hypothetical protein
MRNHDFVSKGFLALTATCLVLLYSSLLVIALLAWLWRTSSPAKPTPQDLATSRAPDLAQ